MIKNLTIVKYDQEFNNTKTCLQLENSLFILNKCTLNVYCAYRANKSIGQQELWCPFYIFYTFVLNIKYCQLNSNTLILLD